MSSDNQFTALGPTIVGFQTHGTNIDTGAELYGVNVGVVASSGVNSNTGVVIWAKPNSGGVSIGVYAADPTRQHLHGIGVRGEGRTGVAGVGLHGGPGGVFTSQENSQETLGAQIRLVPVSDQLSSSTAVAVQPKELPPLDTKGFPKKAEQGDLLAIRDANAELTLWLCTSDGGGKAGMTWRQVLLGSEVRVR